MPKILGDIDIDVTSRLNKQKYGLRAIQVDEQSDKIRPHNSGIFLDTSLPIDPITHMSCCDYKELEVCGFNKIDLLNNTVYERFKTKKEILDCLDIEPDWSQLLNKNFVQQLPHIANHHELLVMVKPTSIEDLSDVLALIRPAKQKYIESYIHASDKTEIRKNLYREPKDGYYIKRSHAIAYAHMIVVVMNKLSKKNILLY